MGHGLVDDRCRERPLEGIIVPIVTPVDEAHHVRYPGLLAAMAACR